MHYNCHRPHNVRGADRLVGGQRCQQENVIGIVQKNIAHKVVSDYCADCSIGIPTGNERAVQRFYDILNFHKRYYIIKSPLIALIAAGWHDENVI
jgi:hypothetical protein